MMAVMLVLILAKYDVVTFTEPAVYRDSSRAIVWIEIDQCTKFALPIITARGNGGRSIGQIQTPMNRGDKLAINFATIAKELETRIEPGGSWTIQPWPCRIRLWTAIPRNREEKE